jgi:hypothetical protein
MTGAMPLQVDRAEVIHFAGRHRLSPALRDGAPALVAPGEPGERGGWERFFAALAARGLAPVFDPEDPSSLSFVPRGGGRADAGRAAPAPSRGAFSEARRFLAALRGRYHPS